MKAFVELFSEVNMTDVMSRELKTAHISDVKIEVENKAVSFVLHTDTPFSMLSLLKAEIEKTYKLKEVTISSSVKATQEFTPAAFEDLLIYCREKEPLCNGFFANATCEMNGDILTIHLSHGGIDILKERKVDALIATKIFSQYGRKVTVAFDGVTTVNNDKEYREKKVEHLKTEQVKTIKIRKEEEKKFRAEVIKGRKIGDDPTDISEIALDSGMSIISGKIFKLEEIITKDGSKLIISFGLYDGTSSLRVKLIVPVEEGKQILEGLKASTKVKVKGDVTFDKFEKDICLWADSINSMEEVKRADSAVEKRIELHLHTNMSNMDGISTATEYIKLAKEFGHPAIAITDHGSLQAFPEAYNSARECKYDGKIIYGIEAYFVNDTVPIVFGSCNKQLDTAYVVFDLETTGLKAESEAITEIGAVKIVNGRVESRFNTFVNPMRPISAKITQLTGITDEMVKDAPGQEEAVRTFIEYCGDAVLVAHNAPFDMSFIKTACTRYSIEFRPVYIDTVVFARKMYPEFKDHKLNTMAEKLEVGAFNHHRASDDSEVLAKILEKMLLKAQLDFGVSMVDDINLKVSGEVDIKRARSFHQIILVKNRKGLRNLFYLVSKSFLDNFYKNPRIPKSLLAQYRDGLLIGSACEAGELYQAILSERPFDEIRQIANFYDYLEIQPLCNNQFLIDSGRVANVEELIKINKKIVELGDKMGLPVVAACDAHFANPEQEIFRRVIMGVNGFADADKKLPLYYRTTEEMICEFSYLGAEKAREVVIVNPAKVVEMCESISPLPPKDVLYKPDIPGVDEELTAIATKRAKEVYGENLPELIQTRLDRELTSIIKHGFAVIYIIAQKLVWKSNADGYLVGSRGSVGSSFAAHMAGITEVNGLPPHYVCPKCKNTEFIQGAEYECGADMPDKDCPLCGTLYNKDGFDIPFETFLGFEADKVPDIDLNFSGEYQPQIHKYTEELLGKEQVFRAGTIGKIQDKTAYGFAKKYDEERSLGSSKIEIERLAEGCTGVKRSTGQHPGGLIVVPKYMEIYDFTPVQHPADDDGSGIITTHFEYKHIHDNLLKLDLLGHDAPTIIRHLNDLTGIDARTLRLDDKQVMSLFSSIEALGIKEDKILEDLGTLAIPEFGTQFVQGMLKQTKPTTFDELVRISGLSHGTDVWNNNAETLIKDGVANLKQVICTRDDIMLYLIGKGMEKKLSFTIMESVRKGKGLKPDWIEAMKANNVPEWYIKSCQTIKYMFPKAHAVAYVTMAFRIAWFKINRPAAFYATYFSVKTTDFNTEYMIYGLDKVKLRHAQLSIAENATAKEKAELVVLEVVYEFYMRGLQFVNIDIHRSKETEFVVVDDKTLLPPLVAIPGLGENAASSIAQARQKGSFESVEELGQLTKTSKTVIEKMRELNILGDMPESAQGSFF